MLNSISNTIPFKKKWQWGTKEKNFKKYIQEPLPSLRPLYIACSTYYGWTMTDKTSTTIM